jgi:uncharacterized protein YndB with AHSA1/START domain
MSVIDVVKDTEQLRLTLVAEYDVTAERAWQLWDDPRQLERWWGPPTYPATVGQHDLTPGGTVTYCMTGPGGDEARGWWRVLEVERPHRLVIEDGFADADGSPVRDMPVVTMRVDIADRDGGGVRMTIEGTFPSIEAMDKLVAMGMDEGLRLAAGQIDGVLAGSAVT